jgi:hypothetical protein
MCDYTTAQPAEVVNTETGEVSLSVADVAGVGKKGSIPFLGSNF